MQLPIEEQIPLPAKIFSNNFVFIPRTVREELGWKAGDELKLYATKKGIFFKK